MKIQIHGYLNNPFGSIQNVCANWARQLRDDYNEVKINDYLKHGCRFPDIECLMGMHDHADMGIYIGYPSYMRTTTNLIAKNKYKVGVFVTEAALSELENEFLRSINWSKVCVPSEFCKKLYGCVPKGLQIVKHGYHDCFRDTIVANHRKRFTFLYVFQISTAGGSIERKNLYNLLDAFKDLRAKNPDVDLIIKTTSNFQGDIPNITRENEGVEIITKYLEPKELFQLYTSCHAYINPTRAEGFGMTVIEAMACGLPVASGLHSGMTEFLTANNCTPIAFRDDKRIRYIHATNDGHIMSVDREAITEAMIRVIDDYPNLSTDAMVRRQSILNEYSWSKVLAGFKGWVKHLENK